MPQNDPENIMRDFHSMMRSLMGPNIRMGEPGRSGPDALFPPNPFGEDGLHGSTFRLGSNGTGPHIVGGRVTYRTTGRLRPRNVDGPQLGGPPVDDLATYASPPNPPSPNGRAIYVISITARPDQLASLIGTILGQMGPLPGHPEDGPQDGEQDGRRNMPRGLQGLFASLLNPANAVHGDAVYSQEALDRIISTLMEQHPTSNAPGPASPSAIAALPKKKLDEKMLGPELKGECSVCMDDVHVGDEVVALPCTHWFHEACASAWLSEHNTCPICRKGIDTDTPSSNSRRSSGSGSTSRNEHRNRRMSMPRRPSRQDTASRNEARLDSIRDRGRLTPPHEAHPTRWQGVGERPRRASSLSPPEMPSGFINSYRRRDSELSENQRDSRRGHTSSSDNSRSSPSGNGGGSSSGNGPISWLRDRFSGSNGRRHD